MRINVNIESIAVEITDDNANRIAAYSADNVHYNLDTNLLVNDLGKLTSLIKQAVDNACKPATEQAQPRGFVPGEQ